MTDYRWNFPTSGLALALDGLAALRAGLGLSDDAMLQNALGDHRNAAGEPATVTVDGMRSTSDAVWTGRPGSAATSYSDALSGKTIDIPAKGDPGRYYMHIRPAREAPGFDPAAYGMADTDPTESADVLGIWAGDEAP
jgi:hypothetical protein